jgi:hypothetical protein
LALILGRLHLGVGLLDLLDPLSRHLRGQDVRDAGFARDDGLDDFEDLVAVMSSVSVRGLRMRMTQSRSTSIFVKRPR